MATEDVWGLFMYKMRAWVKRNGSQKYAELSERLVDWSKNGSTPFMSQVESQISATASQKGMETDRFLDELFEYDDVDDFMEYFEYGTTGLGV